LTERESPSEYETGYRDGGNSAIADVQSAWDEGGLEAVLKLIERPLPNEQPDSR
jgi:hypothetical protein